MDTVPKQCGVAAPASSLLPALCSASCSYMAPSWSWLKMLVKGRLLGMVGTQELT